MLYAFEYAYKAERDWGPIGQFGWKGLRGDSSPLMSPFKEIEAANDTWPPVAAGLCGGSIEKAKSIAAVFTRSMAHSSW
jgi:hypothetical protein